MRRRRRTKVVATLGPASSDRVTIERLFAAGADVFRINMSHTNPERMRELVTTIRAIETEHGRPIGVLVDLQGPKLRLGTFKDGSSEIDTGQDFTLDADAAPGDANRVQLPHPEIFAAIKPDDTLLVDDGKLRLKATEVTPQRIVTRVEVGGKVSNRKGVSLPDTVLPLAALASKDIADLEAALDAGVDWIALSFIQRPEDVAEAKKLTRGRAAVMAKIEKPQAVARLGDILEIADALMVARGDLGVEMPLERVPGVQKEMTRACRRAGKPIVVATQMLESMISSPVPTRAEVSDVATAIFDGADAVMLSAEFGVGPVSGPSGRDHEPHRRGGRGRQHLFAVAARLAHRAGTNWRRCDRRCDAPSRRDARSRRDRLLDLLRLDRSARVTRTAEMPDCRDFADRRRWAEIVGGLGHPLRHRRGCARPERYGRARLPYRV